MGVDSWPAGGPASRRGSLSADESLRPRRAGSGFDPGTRGPQAGSNGSRVSYPASAPTRSTPPVRARQPPPARHRANRPGLRRPDAGPLGDSRGLTAAGGFVLLLLAGGLGALLDRLLGHNLWVLFSVLFVAAVLLNAARIHLEDLAASIVMVPLAYAVVGAASSAIAHLGADYGLRQYLVGAAGVLVFSAPVLILAVVLAAVLALARGRSAMLARRRARTRATRKYGALPSGARPGPRPRAGTKAAARSSQVNGYEYRRRR
jgi:hypothetical protein